MTTYFSIIETPNTAGRLANLTQALATKEAYSVDAVNRTKTELAGTVYWTNLFTGCYMVSVSDATDGLNVVFRLLVHADDQAEFADCAALHMREIEASIAALPSASEIWAAITTAAKTAIANAVYAVIGSRVTVVSPQSENNDLTIYSGTDYLDADNRALSFSSANWPDLTGASIAFVTAGVGSVACVLDTVGAGITQSFHLDLTAVNSAKIPNSQTYYCQATLANEHVVRLVTGDIDLRA